MNISAASSSSPPPFRKNKKEPTAQFGVADEKGGRERKQVWFIFPSYKRCFVASKSVFCALRFSSFPLARLGAPFEGCAATV